MISQSAYNELESITARYSSVCRSMDYCFDIDPYCTEKPHYHAMACATVCQASCKLFKLKGHKEYLSDAENCADILDRIKSETATGMCWGLPYVWKEKPATHPYMITTVLCADAILSLYELTGKMTI